MQALAIVILSILAAVAYGIIHDQITARVCVEYFTIGHPPVFATDDPTLLGIGWGIVATWWMGLLLGIPLAVASRAGRRAKRTAASLLRPVAWLLGIMVLSALTAGIIGWALASHGMIGLNGTLRFRVPPDKHVLFLADLWAHLASYIVGFVGGIVVIVRVWRSRSTIAARESTQPMQRPVGPMDPSPEELERRRQWFEWYADQAANHSVRMPPRDEGRYQCPCCGHRTLLERGGDDICPVCFWEDDGQDDHDAEVVRGGPNRGLSLTQARTNYRTLGACDERSRRNVRPPLPDEVP